MSKIKLLIAITNSNCSKLAVGPRNVCVVVLLKVASVFISSVRYNYCIEAGCVNAEVAVRISLSEEMSVRVILCLLVADKCTLIDHQPKVVDCVSNKTQTSRYESDQTAEGLHDAD